MPLDPHSAAALVPQWRGQAVSLTPLAGGLTNTNFCADVAGERFVLRLFGEGTELLSVDRHLEHQHTAAAAAAGIGPRVLAHLGEHGVMVLEFLEGETLSAARLREPGMPSRLGEAIGRLHRQASFVGRFDMWELARRYRQVLAELQEPLPEAFADYDETLAQVERVLARAERSKVACHNDLLAENLIDDGQMLRMIDFEYSGTNDAYFELGNTAQEQEYDDDQIGQLVGACLGHATAADLARVKLNMICSDAGWALWAAIQQSQSTIDFDYAQYAKNRWARARAKLDAREFGHWLADAVS